MRKYVWNIAAALAIATATLLASGTAQAQTQDDTVHILFIGNSLTYYNNMPVLFQHMLERVHPGLRLDIRYVTADGLMLEDHWKSPWTQARLHEKSWNYVVLQEQGGLGRWVLNGASHPEDPRSFNQHVDQFSAIVRAAGGNVVLYESAPSSPTRLGYLEWAYTQAANRNQAILAPVGTIFYRFDQTTLDHWLPKDTGHPSAVGSCVIAATLAASIFSGPAQPLLDACDHRDKTTASVGATIDSVIKDIGARGTYNQVSPPVFASPPAPTPGEALTPAALSGDWYARDSGLPLSFGVRMRLSREEGTWHVALDNYGPNTRMGMPPERVGIEGNELRVDTRGDGRHYRFILTRKGDVLAGFALASINGGTTYQPVSFRRLTHSDPYFSHLDALQDDFDRERKAAGLDAALTTRYKALNQWLGSETVERYAWGVPASEPWTTILTGQNYADLGNDMLALDYFSYAVRHFPKNSDAYAARGTYLQERGHHREALPDMTRAAALRHAGHVGGAETEYDWWRDKLKAELGIDAATPPPTGP